MICGVQILLPAMHRHDVGVNKYTLDKEEPVEVLSIDNAKTIESQVRGIVARDTCLLAIPLANWACRQTYSGCNKELTC